VESQKRRDLPFLVGPLSNQGDQTQQGGKAASVGGLFQLPPRRAALVGPLDALAVMIPQG
jgi:hypothetical protein